jgi:hypothetical protein
MAYRKIPRAQQTLATPQRQTAACLKLFVLLGQQELLARERHLRIHAVAHLRDETCEAPLAVHARSLADGLARACEEFVVVLLCDHRKLHALKGNFLEHGAQELQCALRRGFPASKKRC